MGVFDHALQSARCLLVRVTGHPMVDRSTTEQAGVDADSGHLVLYDMPTCPYCCMVKRRIDCLGLNIQVRDVVSDDDAYQTLIEATGRSQVPCLNISDPGGESRWMFESRDIVDYLQGRFSA